MNEVDQCSIGWAESMNFFNKWLVLVIILIDWHFNLFIPGINVQGCDWQALLIYPIDLIKLL